MSLIDDTAERFLRIAAARWPEDLRDDQSREWAGELWAIRHDAERGRLRRRWAQLRYAFSLAASPPVEDPDKIPKGWREIMPELGKALRRVLLLVGAGALCAGVQTLPNLIGNGIGEAFPGFSSDWSGRVYGVFVALTVATVLCLAGRRLGRALPLSLRHDRRGNAPITAGIVVLCLGAAPFAFNGDIDAVTTLEKMSFLLWAIPFAVMLTFVFRLARSGHNRGAWLLGIGGGLLLFEVIAVPIGLIFGYIGPIPNSAWASTPSTENLSHVDFAATPLWFLASLSGPHGGRWYDGAVTPELYNTAVTTGMATVMPTILAATTFAIGYLISSARHATAPAPAVATTPASAPVQTSAARRYSGLAITGFAILVWAAVVGVLTPMTSEYSLVDIREFGNWAIVLAAVGLVWARSGRVAALLPGVGFGVATLAAGVVIDRVNFAGPGGFLLAAGVAGAIAVGAWLAANALEARRPGGADLRRTTVAVAIFAGYCAAGILAQSRLPGGFSPTGSVTLDVSLRILAAVLAVSFVVIAIAATISARDTRLSAGSWSALVLGFAAFAAAGYWSIMYGPVFWNVSPGGFVMAPLALFLALFIQWGGCDRSGADYLKWGSVMLVTLIAAPFLMQPQVIVGGAVGDWLILLSAPGVDQSWGGGSLMSGIVLAASVLAMFVASRAVRQPRPATATTTTHGPVTGEVAPA